MSIPAGSNLRSCAACGDPLGLALQQLGFIARDPYRPCTGCGMLQATPDPVAETSFYANVYPHLPHKQDEALGRVPVFATTIGQLRTRSRGSRLLDVGCGTGDFLSLAKASGFVAEGVEVSAELAEAASKRSGCPVRSGGISSVAPIPAFHAITLWNVLDQVPDPLALLGDVRRLLLERGVLFLRIPNGTVHRQLMALTGMIGPRASRWGISGLTPFHPFVLRPRDLSRMLIRTGFSEIEIEGSPVTRGSVSLPLALARRAAETSAWLLAQISAKRICIAPSLQAWAIRTSP